MNNYQESLSFFELTEDFNEAELKKKYHQLIKKYHPDVNNMHESSYAKVINAHYNNLLNYYKGRMKLVNDGKSSFIERLKQDLKKYNNDMVKKLVDEVLIELNKTETLEEVIAIEKEYTKQIEIILNKELLIKKNNLKNYYTNKFLNYAINHNLEKTSIAYSVLGKIYDLIINATKDTIDQVIESIATMSFENKNIYLNNIYINISNGCLSLDDKEFYNDKYLNLKDFMKRSGYVGNIKVAMILNNKNIFNEIPFTHFLYYDYLTGLMLLYNEREDNFEFCPSISYFNPNSNKKFEIDVLNRKEEFRNGKFRDIDYVYDLIKQQILRNAKNYK